MPGVVDSLGNAVILFYIYYYVFCYKGFYYNLLFSATFEQYYTSDENGRMILT